MAAPAIRFENDFQRQTSGLSVTPDFNTRLEQEMRDPLATFGQRVLAWIKRYSWGNGSLWAIHEKTGRVRLQRDCVKELGINKRRVSQVVRYYVQRGYLIDHPKLLYLIPSPILKSPIQKSPRDADFSKTVKFMDTWKVSCSTDFESYERAKVSEKVARTERRRTEKVRRAAYEEWLKSQEPEVFEAPCTVLVPTSIEIVGRYSTATSPPDDTAYLPTEPKTHPEHKTQSVEDLILGLPAVKRLEEKLHDTLRQPLLGQITDELNGAPIDRLNDRINVRFERITSFGGLVWAAADVRKAWKAEQKRIQNAAEARRIAEVAEWRRILEPDSGESEQDREIARRCLQQRGLLA